MARVGLLQLGAAPIASEALTRIAELYRIESDIRGMNAPERGRIRQIKSRPVLDALEPWLRAKLGLISQKSKLAEAIRYALVRWDGLIRFVDDGRIEIDSNVVERAIRPLALTRKNALFAGSDVGASYCSPGDDLIKVEDFVADPEISGDVIAWHRLRGTHCLAADRRAG